MKWLNFLHFYQPATQQFDVLEAVVTQSYLPIFKKINETPDAQLTINISGSLLELFDKFKYHNLIDLICQSVAEGKVELTGSCMYHALVPLIPADELSRQIKTNTEALKFYVNKDINPKGFFPPEMAYSPTANAVIKESGFSWIVLDEIAYAGGKSSPSPAKLYETADTGLKLFFRDRRVSNLVMAAVARTPETIKEALKEEFKSRDYLVTGMDGETFGHHRPGLETLLFEIMRKDNFNTQKISDFLAENQMRLPVEKVNIVASTWASSYKDISDGVQFCSWQDPTNVIHKNQWEFLNLALGLVKSVSPDIQGYEMLRKKMDVALASDHFWWACAKPWWSIEMIEDGAFKLLDLVRSVPNVDKSSLETASRYYETIVSIAFDWQRTGKIREMNRQRNEYQRIPFKERTLEKGGHQAAVYEAFISMFKDQEQKAVKTREYEKAMMWRDALFKIENKLDIFETMNAVDLLRIEIGNGEVERMLDKYTEKFHQIRGGQPEQRD